MPLDGFVDLAKHPAQHFKLCKAPGVPLPTLLPEGDLLPMPNAPELSHRGHMAGPEILKFQNCRQEAAQG